MNICLLAKYLGERGILSYKRNNGSPFWRVSYQLERMCPGVLIYIIGNGNKIRFRLDVWIGNCAFEDGYSMTF
jgi:hypothetical protein